MDFKEKEMNLELKEQDSEHNKKKKEEGSPKRKKGCFKRVLSVLVLVVIIGFREDFAQTKYVRSFCG